MRTCLHLLHRLILRFLLEKEDSYGNTWGRRRPGATEWDPPVPSLREKD